MRGLSHLCEGKGEGAEEEVGEALGKGIGRLKDCRLPDDDLR